MKIKPGTAPTTGIAVTHVKQTKQVPVTKGRVLAVAADYNGYKDVLFMFKADDFRLTDERFSGGYTILGDAEYVHKTRTLTCGGKTYRVYPDWSVKEGTWANAA